MLTKPNQSMLDLQLEDIPGQLPADRVDGLLTTGKKVWRTSLDSDLHLFNAQTEVTAFRKNVFIPDDGLVFVTYHVDTKHRGLDAGGSFGANYPIGIGMWAKYRTASTEAGLSGASLLDVPKAIASGNIFGIQDHYFMANIARAPLAVVGGMWYQMAFSASAHTDAGTVAGTDGTASFNTYSGATNMLLWEYEPGAVLEP